MSTSTADNHFSFTLPTLSYVDTSQEDQNLDLAERPAPAGGSSGWMSALVAAFRLWNAERKAMAELSLMTDRELMDVGLNRGDFGRMFNETANADLRERGAHN